MMVRTHIQKILERDNLIHEMLAQNPDDVQHQLQQPLTPTPVNTRTTFSDPIFAKKLYLLNKRINKKSKYANRSKHKIIIDEINEILDVIDEEHEVKK